MGHAQVPGCVSGLIALAPVFLGHAHSAHAAIFPRAGCAILVLRSPALLGWQLLPSRQLDRSQSPAGLLCQIFPVRGHTLPRIHQHQIKTHRRKAHPLQGQLRKLETEASGLIS